MRLRDISMDRFTERVQIVKRNPVLSISQFQFQKKWHLYGRRDDLVFKTYFSADYCWQVFKKSFRKWFNNVAFHTITSDDLRIIKSLQPKYYDRVVAEVIKRRL